MLRITRVLSSSSKEKEELRGRIFFLFFLLIFVSNVNSVVEEEAQTQMKKDFESLSNLSFSLFFLPAEAAL